MKTVFEHLRTGLLANCNETPKLPSIEVLSMSEWCSEFEQLMRNRLIMGAFRYGRNFENRPADKPQYNRMKRMKEYCDEYIKTGNKEILVDMANTAMLEFGENNHPKAHFKATDDGKHTEPVVS